MIDGESSGLAPVFPVIDHRLAQRLLQPVRAVAFSVKGDQALQVHQVISAALRALDRLAEADALAPPLGEPGEPLGADQIRQGGEVLIHLPDHPGDPGQIRAGQRAQGFAARLGFDIQINDPAGRAFRLRILRQIPQEAVVPPGRGLRLLGGDQIVRPGAEGGGHLDGAHQAGVETDPAELFRLPRGFQGQPQLVQRQPVRGVLLVQAYAAEGPGAVVPEDQRVALRRIPLPREAHQPGQRFRIAHAERRGFLLQLPGFVIPDLRQHGALPALPVVPSAGAARHHEHVQFALVKPGILHLLQIPGGAGTLALQIAAAHVDDQRQGLLRAALGPGRRHPRRQQEKNEKQQTVPFFHLWMLPSAVRHGPCETVLPG